MATSWRSSLRPMSRTADRHDLNPATNTFIRMRRTARCRILAACTLRRATPKAVTSALWHSCANRDKVEKHAATRPRLIFLNVRANWSIAVLWSRSFRTWSRVAATHVAYETLSFATAIRLRTRQMTRVPRVALFFLSVVVTHARHAQATLTAAAFFRTWTWSFIRRIQSLQTQEEETDEFH